ncbi:hypothetical protein ABZ348_15905 [Streptomyces sp. NPDC005963]|uniref:hypothetical protein n=1 Tax=Streptomyces sp. NPDC005963 TaxID=3156721 RepID=UPI0033F02A28
MQPEHQPEHKDETAERELRVLLERGTPRLATPDGLLHQVRERVVRRRRLKAAGVAGSAAVALTLAGVLLLPAPDDSHQPVLTARPPVPAAPTANTVAFPELDGLTIQVPRRWNTLTMPVDPQLDIQPQGFIATQRIAPFPRPCRAEYANDCLPVERLGPKDVLITVTTGGPGKDRLDRRASRTLKPMGVDDNCAAIGGVTTRAADLLSDSQPHPLVLSAFRVCAAAGTTAETWAEVQKMIDSAHRLGPADTYAPSTPTGR